MSDDGFLPLDPNLLADLLTPEVWQGLIDNNGYLTGEALVTLWRRMEMQGEPPERMMIQVLRADVDKLIRTIKRRQKLERRAARAHGGTA
jgi:hypothetical protein